MIGLLRWRGSALASAYRLADRIVVCRAERTRRGLAIPVEPILTLPRGAPPEELGRALRRCLEGPGRPHPDPHDWTRVWDAVVAAAGVSSHRWLQQSAVLIRVRRTGRSVELVPATRRSERGSARPSRPLPGARATIRVGVSDAEFGTALAEAFGRAAKASGGPRSG